MPTFREIATVRKRGGDLPDVRAGELQTNAWLVHEAMLTKAKRDGRPYRYDGIDGYEWYGFMADIFRELWPGVAEEDRSAVMTEGEGAEKAISSFLKRTRNATCLTVGTRRTDPPTFSRWWVRAEFSEEKIPAPQAVSAAERKVTRQEAGEDRGPAEVQQSFQCTWDGCKTRFASLTQRTKHIFATHRPAEDWVLRALEVVPVPATPTMIWEHLRDHMGYPGSASQLIYTVAEMASEVGSEVVNVARPPRRQPVYALRHRLEEMPDGDYFSPVCRHPGCGRDFTSSWMRNDHEKRFHPDSPYRVWDCKAPGCDNDLPFFDKSGVSMHMRRSHPMDSDEYTAYMRLSESEATSKLAKLPPVRIAGLAIVSAPPRPEPSRPKAPAPAWEAPAQKAPEAPAQADLGDADADAGMPSSSAAAAEALRAMEALIEENAGLLSKLATSPGPDAEEEIRRLREENASLQAENQKLKDRVAKLTAMTRFFLEDS